MRMHGTNVDSLTNFTSATRKCPAAIRDCFLVRQGEKSTGANLVQAGALSFVLAKLLHLVAVHGIAAGVRRRLPAVVEQEMY
jgi:hypothetical protein